MKKSIKIGALALAVASAGFCLVGCTQEDSAIKNIDISGNFQTEYLVGDQLNLQGAKLVLTYKDGEQKTINITSSMIENFDTRTAGDKSLKVAFDGKTIDVDYKVVASDFEYIFSNIRTNFLATRYVEVINMRHDPDTQSWQNYDKYVRNNNLLYVYDFTSNNYNLYNYDLQKVYDSSESETTNHGDISNLESDYSYACAFLVNTSLPGQNVYNKQVKIENHKYTLNYTMLNGENSISCKIVSTFDLKIESCDANQTSTGNLIKLNYNYTNVQTLSWPV